MIADAAKNDAADGRDLLIGDGFAKFGRLRDMIANDTAYNRKNGAAAVRAGRDSYTSTRTFILGALVAAGLSSIAISLLLMRDIARRLCLACRHGQAVARRPRVGYSGAGGATKWAAWRRK